MKKIYVLMLITQGLVTVLNAQTYYPFLTNTDWYIVTGTQVGPSFSWYNTENDTIIQSKTYKKIIQDSTSTLTYFVREDTLSKQTWVILPFDSTITEKLLYDFTLILGDSIDLTWSTNDIYTFYVSQIDTITTLVGDRKRIRLLSNEHQFLTSMYWIQGIGCEQGPFYLNKYLFVEGTHQLMCTYKNGIKAYDYQGQFSCPPPPPLTTSMGEKENSAGENELSINPNPTTGEVTFTTNKGNQISVYNVTGELVRNIPFASQNTITLNVGEFAQGIYFVQLQSENGKLTYGKLVVHSKY